VGYFNKIGYLYVDLHLMKEYVQMFEEMLDEKLEELNLWTEKELAKLNNDMDREIFIENHVIDEKWKLNSEFPNMFRKSLFVSIYSRIEHELNRICRKYEGEYEIDLKDFRKDKGIKRAQKYLKEVVNVDFPDETKEWNKINHYNFIRNNIVHNKSKITKIKKIQSFINSEATIGLDNLNYINIRKGFCLKVIETMSNFFEQLNKKLP
jgi:hypothetical protein